MSPNKTNGHIESDEVIAKRKDFFTKFAKRSAARAEKQRLQNVPEEPPPTNVSHQNYSRPWLSGLKMEAWEEAQLEYVKPYTAEYEIDGIEARVATTNINDQTENQENISSAVSETSELDTVASLRSIRTVRSRFLKNRLAAATASNRSSIPDFERVSTVKPPTVMTSNEEYTSNISVHDLRNTYFRRYKTNKDLPIHHHREYLINSINSYSVVMISGATGCGKTTQVPAYILEDAVLGGQQNRAPVIYVTQPRRIAARSIARRVCEEHNWELGSIVGYQVGLDKKVGPDTILVFCTAGVLLQKLITEKTLKGYTHIIVDEAHERDADTDLLLMFIRLLMRQEMSYFRLVVMSATMEMKKLKNYFTFRTTYGHSAATTPSIVKIEGREPNDIQVLYLDKIRSTFNVEMVMPEFDYDQPELHDECLKAAYQIITEKIPYLDTFSGATESTLVFLPGLAEISKLHSMLKKAGDHLDIIPLHSCLSPVDHDRVFRDSEGGKRKVILATNIAESSITVKDVGFIIDFCLTKSLVKDSITNFPSLTLQWSSKDKSTQRAGRTGRCCPGKVFRMVTADFYKQFSDYAKPELLLAPLELSVLRVKSFNMGEVKALLAVVLDPPPINEIRTAVLELKQIGALSSTYEGKISDMDGDMTELGRVISALPIDVHLSKLIVLASVLDVLEDAIIVAACLSTNRTVVKHLYGNQPETYRMKLEWAKGSYSDLFVSLDVYKDYMEQRNKKKDQQFLMHYCNNKHLDEKKLYEVTSLISEIKHRLEQVNITIYDQPNRVRNIYEDELMLKIAFCASFYPNYFLTRRMDVEDIQREYCGLDPTKTLIMYHYPVNHVPLYRAQTLEQIQGRHMEEGSDEARIIIDNEIDFISEYSKALLVFKDKNKMPKDENSSRALGISGVIQPSKDIDKSIYLAIKLGQWRRYYVREFWERIAEDRMQYYKNKVRDIPMEGRVAPPRIKLVVGRPADNSRLVEEDYSEFIRLTNQHYYVEVELAKTQEQSDLNELRKLEKNEQALIKHRRTNQLNDISHPLYKGNRKPLQGPISPIQMQFRSILEKSKGYTVEIDSLSVNSILLNPDYTVPRRQMLVAAAVNHSKRNRIMACDTTLMPNIRGLPTLMALMFAQYYRLVYDKEKNCIAGGIFGLGWDEEDTPVDKNYEVELGFDVEISKDDIELINRARKNISELIKFIDIQNPGAPRAQLQQQLRQIILSLIKRRRTALEEVSVASLDWTTTERYLKDKHNVPANQLTRLEGGETRIFLPIMQQNFLKSEAELEENKNE